MTATDAPRYCLLGPPPPSALWCTVSNAPCRTGVWSAGVSGVLTKWVLVCACACSAHGASGHVEGRR